MSEHSPSEQAAEPVSYYEAMNEVARLRVELDGDGSPSSDPLKAFGVRGCLQLQTEEIARLRLALDACRQERDTEADINQTQQRELEREAAATDAAEARVQALEAENVRLEAQWGIMARACGNHRYFNTSDVTKLFTEWETKEFQAAAAAILQLASLSAALQTYGDHLPGCPAVFVDNPRLDGVPDICTCGLTDTLRRPSSPHRRHTSDYK